ncbi:nucleoside diphosphate kinase A isoform X1 [Callithrix jacchus]|uniref:Nucleoside diphosphate kinase n=1 Tax=Callithrix jacchus TaxID=9483 RepID=A0A8I3WDW2_CALJA|nr:nucleoside diphosphate kinase A isoform X1 [Callithrix jacchus]
MGSLAADLRRSVPCVQVLLTTWSPEAFRVLEAAAGVQAQAAGGASEDLLKEHYIDLKDRPFFAGLVKYMHSGPVVAMVWEGLNVVKTGRVMLGETNPADSKPGTIRGDFCIQVGRNIIHGSDSVESAEKEIGLWFHPEELVDYKSCAQNWIYE